MVIRYGVLDPLCSDHKPVLRVLTQSDKLHLNIKDYYGTLIIQTLICLERSCVLCCVNRP